MLDTYNFILVLKVAVIFSSAIQKNIHNIQKTHLNLRSRVLDYGSAKAHRLICLKSYHNKI